MDGSPQKLNRGFLSAVGNKSMNLILRIVQKVPLVRGLYPPFGERKHYPAMTIVSQKNDTTVVRGKSCCAGASGL
jgi:hypothetical protein